MLANVCSCVNWFVKNSCLVCRSVRSRHSDFDTQGRGAAWRPVSIAACTVRHMRLGFMSNAINSGTIDDVVAEAREALEAGAHTFWSSQIFGHDALTVLAIVGREVPGIELGTAVVPTYPRHPMMLAQQALSTQAAINSRGSAGLCLGIGLSHQVVVESMWGLSYSKPVRHLKEYLSILMPLLEGKPVKFEGDRKSVV